MKQGDLRVGEVLGFRNRRSSGRSTSFVRRLERIFIRSPPHGGGGGVRRHTNDFQ